MSGNREESHERVRGNRRDERVPNSSRPQSNTAHSFVLQTLFRVAVPRLFFVSRGSASPDVAVAETRASTVGPRGSRLQRAAPRLASSFSRTCSTYEERGVLFKNSP